MKNKTNFIAIVFVAAVAVALAVANNWVTIATLNEAILAVIAGIGAIATLYKTLEGNEKDKTIKQKNAEIYRQKNYIQQLEKK